LRSCSFPYGPAGILNEAGQKVDVAIGAEIVYLSRSKEGRLGSLPAAAEVFEALGGPKKRGGCEVKHVAAFKEAASQLYKLEPMVGFEPTTC
jgi:hypothetical protein